MLHKLGNQSFYLLLSQQIRRYHKRTSSLTFPLDFKLSRVKVYSTLWWIHKRIDIGKHVEGDWWPKRPKCFHIVQYLCYHINRESSIAASRFSYNIAVNSYSISFLFTQEEFPSASFASWLASLANCLWWGCFSYRIRHSTGCKWVHRPQTLNCSWGLFLWVKYYLFVSENI